MQFQLPINPSNIERFKSNLPPPDENGCLRWGAGKCDGCGRFFIDGETRYAHIVAYLIAYGEIPPGKHVLHTCRVKDCCNPEHLQLGIAKQTTLDNLEERFEAKIKHCCNEKGCDEWAGSRNAQGYGKFCFQGKLRTATHIAYFLSRGEWPVLRKDDGIRHHCDHPWCVNPGHLYIGDAQDDANDRVSRGRTAKGQKNGMYTHPENIKKCESNWNAKLTNEQAIVIRRTCEANPKTRGLYAALGRKFKIHETVVSDIANRVLWKELSDDFSPNLKPIPIQELEFLARSGDDCPHKVLDSVKAGEIGFLHRRAKGRWGSIVRLSRRYGIGTSQVQRIINGEQWQKAPEYLPHFEELEPLFSD